MLKKVIKHKLSKLQVDAGEEALRLDQDRSVEIVKIAKEAEELRAFLSVIDLFEAPNPELGLYQFVTPEI